MANKMGTGNAVRQRRYRLRRSKGRIFLLVEVDETPLVEKLIQAEFLRPEDCDDRDALTAAAELVLDLWAKGP